MAHGTVMFARDVCKGCALCVDACPEHMLAMDATLINRLGYHPAGVVEGRQEDCIACVRCVDMCPDQVITLTKRVVRGRR